MRVLLFLILAMLSTCEAQSKLPKEMPANTEMTYTTDGGMLPSFFRAAVVGKKLTLTNRSAETGHKDVVQEMTLGDEEVRALYGAFVESGFDSLKPNEDRGVADGRSRTIELKFGGSHYTAINGDGYEPPKGHGERFARVEAAFGKIISAHRTTTPGK